MKDSLETVRELVEAHHIIRAQVKEASGLISDLDAVFGLQKAYSSWTLSSIEALSERQKNLQQTIDRFAEGLRNHFVVEERELPPLLGEVLMKALVFEHQQIEKQINEARSVVANIRLEGLSQEEVLARKSHVQQVISETFHLVEQHATKENTLLKMVESALEAKS